MRDLRLYRSKRDPEQTPEPFGEEAERGGGASAPRGLPPGARRLFVVQQHAARQLHFDLRLEIDGALVSWAVPKGPSLDPAERRLAVQTEDHPLEYADFEGVIPAGNYGAGAMIVWDRGVYRSVDGRGPAEGLAAGKLDLLLEGHKLRGRFALVRTARGKGRDWLLLCKGRRPEEDAEVGRALPASVFSGLRVEELREGVSRDAGVEALLERNEVPRRRVDFAKLRPMLASPGEQAFSRAGWLFELKYDGVRVLAEKRGDEVRIVSRTGGDRTTLYPEVAAALRHLPLHDFVLDGEIVALDERGQSSFERLQRRFTQSDAEGVARVRHEVPVQLMAFDLLAALGRDLRQAPLLLRKAILAELVPGRGLVGFADHVEQDGLALFQAAEAHGLEGVVAKQADSAYEAGRRSKRWVKLKVPRSASLVVVGVLPGKGSRKALGSLALAWWSDGALVHAGNVGSGLGEETIDALLEALEPQRREAPCFEGGPEAWPRGSWFVEPELVVEVRFTEVTGAGSLRHPVFLGVRDDVAPAECRAPGGPPAEPEAPAASLPEPDLHLTRLDKVFWPVEGYTKGDLLAWYEAVWPWLEPHLKDRPVVLTRYPDGIEGKHFYQKNAPEFTPDWVRREGIDGTDYFVCNDLRTLLYVVNSGAIPLHVWHSRVGSLEHPDWCVIDLDPKEAPFEDVVTIARHLHRLLGELGAAHFVKSSGQDGLHVLLPLGGALSHTESRMLGEALARTVVAELPEIATVTRPVAARGTKVYVDFLQNGRGKLIASAFSVRPRAGAPVSMPLTWRQVTRRLDPAKWNISTALQRLRRSGDPSAGVLGPGVDVEGLLTALQRRLERA